MKFNPWNEPPTKADWLFGMAIFVAGVALALAGLALYLDGVKAGLR